MGQFIGRQQELALLEGLCLKQTSSLVVVYGRRRIGKSRLIEEFAKKHRFISFSGMFPEKGCTKQDQLDEFRNQFIAKIGHDPGKLDDWGNAFRKLADSTSEGRVVILLDEITWMAHKDVNFLGKLKTVWDMEFKKNDKLLLVICGSISVWIEKNLLSHRGFYGRISLKIKLQDLTLSDCAKFWGNQQNYTSAYEKLKILSVTGGIPKYLEEIRPDQSAEENIKRLGFSKNGLLFNDYSTIFLSLLEHDSQLYQKILEHLNERSLPRSDFGIGHGNGVISGYLEELTVSGFLQRDYTWHLTTGKTAKLSKYRLSDNYLRFYIKYILPNQKEILDDKFENHSLSALPGWPAIMGLQIENLVLNNRRQIRNILGIHPDELVNDGPFFQKQTARQNGCQIDYLIQLKYGVLYLCEIKCRLGTINTDVISEVQEKIDRLTLPKKFSIKPVLIYIGDLHDDVIGSQYFTRTIDLASLLEG